MRFYKYWTRAVGKVIAPDGEEIFRSATGYSNASMEDAFRLAEQRAQKNAQYWTNPSRIDGQYYPANGERPIREETVEQFADDQETYAVISRNSYGCLVLNTSDVFFADVDKPYQGKLSQFIAWFTGLFGKRKAEEPDFEDRLVQKIKTLVEQDRQMGLRVYRTLHGYRILLTSQTVPASEAKSIELLEKLGSDKLYVSLCRSQDCYRARLTPKAWRCGADKPTLRFPFTSPETEQLYRQWEKRYASIAGDFATCALIGDFGSTQIHPRVAAVAKLHDVYVLNEGKPLA